MPTIEEILRSAREAGASDVHLTTGIPPKMRINGRLITMDYARLLPADILDVALHIMTEAQREIFEEKGEFDLSFSIPRQGRYRVNAYKQRGSAAMVFRLVGSKIPSALELGIPEAVMNLYQKKKGLIVAAGPSGSGKSATLAVIIDQINSYRESHVLTLENPIEFLHHHKLSMVNQREIGLDLKSYADGLRAAMREDADVILVGELCDCETVSMAISAAETGHLVLSTIAAVGTAGTVSRLVQMFEPQQQQQIREQLAGVLETVIFQQLLPLADGHSSTAAFEVMNTNQEVRSLIREGRFLQLTGAIKSNRESGMMSMDEAILQLYYQGKINFETAVQAAMNSDDMRKKLADTTNTY